MLKRYTLSDHDPRTGLDILGKETIVNSFDARAYIERGVEHIFKTASQPR